MSAPSLADWTTRVNWSSQCEGLNWSGGGEPQDELPERFGRIGVGPRSDKYPTMEGGAFIAAAEAYEAKVKARRLADAKRTRRKGAGGKETSQDMFRLPGRWDHMPRHKSHLKRYRAGTAARRERVSHSRVQLVSSSNLPEDMKQLCSDCGFVWDSDKSCWCSTLNNLAGLANALKSRASLNLVRCETSSFTVLEKIYPDVRPLAGKKVSFTTPSEAISPVAPQKREWYSYDSLCRIADQMKHVNVDLGTSDTVWVWIQHDEEATLQHNPHGELRNGLEQGEWFPALPEPKVHIPPKRPHLVNFGRGASTNPSIGTSPVASVPSGDIRNFRYRKALQRAKTASPERNSRRFRARAQTASARSRKKRPPSQQLSRSERQHSRLRRWQQRRVADVDLMLGSMDISNLSHDVVSRQLKFLQDGIERIYSRKAAPKKRTKRKQAQNQHKKKSTTTIKKEMDKTEDKEKPKLSPEEMQMQRYRSILRLICTQDDIDPNKLVNAFTRDTCLIMACRHGHASSVTYLLQLPTIDINKFNKAGETPLLAAVRSRSMNIMQQLCSATEINVNIADKKGTSPLRASVELGSAEAFDMLFAHKSLDHSATREGDTSLLHAAAACSRVRMLEVLLGSVVLYEHLNWGDENGNTPLHLAATHGHAAVTDLLLAQNDVDVRAHNKERNTAIHLACGGGHTDILRKLCDVDELARSEAPRASTAQNKHGHTPLHLAALGGFVDSVSYLRSQPEVDVRCADASQYTPFHLAASKGHVGVLMELCKFYRAMDIINRPGTDKLTALAVACRAGHYDAVKFLCDLEHVNINQDCGDHGSALFVACEAGNRRIASFLVDRGARLGATKGKALARKLWRKVSLALSPQVRDGILKQERLKEDVLAAQTELEESMEKRLPAKIIFVSEKLEFARARLREFRNTFCAENTKVNLTG